MGGVLEQDLVRKFVEAVEAAFPTGPIFIDKVAVAIAYLMGKYGVCLSPEDRAVLLSMTVDKIIQMFNDNHNADLLIN